MLTPARPQLQDLPKQLHQQAIKGSNVKAYEGCVSSKLPQKEQKKPVTHESQGGVCARDHMYVSVCVPVLVHAALQGCFCCCSPRPGLGLQVCATDTGSFWGAGDPAQVLMIAQQARY